MFSHHIKVESHNYCTISKCSVLAKNFLSDDDIQIDFQSGFRIGHSTITSATAVINGLICAQDRKQHRITLFMDLSEAFDSVDHNLLLKKLTNTGFGPEADKWFQNDLVN